MVKKFRGIVAAVLTAALLATPISLATTTELVYADETEATEVTAISEEIAETDTDVIADSAEAEDAADLDVELEDAEIEDAAVEAETEESEKIEASDADEKEDLAKAPGDGQLSAAEEAGIGAFVKRLYKVCFGRDADSTGYKTWTTVLKNGSFTGAQVAAGFVFSDEFKKMNLCPSCYVDAMYAAFFDRSADAAGKKTWVNMLQSGGSRGAVFNGFIFSTEFEKLCARYGITRGNGDWSGITVATGGKCSKCGAANQTISDFITRMYSTCLGRNPDKSGLNTWINYLLNGHTGTETAAGFIFSDEMMYANLSHADLVDRFYKAFFNRSADANGKKTWVNLLDGGATVGTVFNGFTQSTEFANLCKSYGVTQGKGDYSDRDYPSPPITFTSAHLAIIRNIIGAEETGGLVYGQREYSTCFVGSGEAAVTLGWACFYGENAKKVLQRIQKLDAKGFKSVDSKSLIANELSKDWWSWKPTSEQKKIILKLITSEAGKKAQDQIFDEMVADSINYCKANYTTDARAIIMFVDISHQGGLSAGIRIFDKCKGNYSISHILSVLDQDLNNDIPNQVGDYTGRRHRVAEWINKYVQ